MRSALKSVNYCRPQTEVASKCRSVVPQQQQLAPETPLNLSTKPKAKGIWSPASLCEEEQSRRTSLGKVSSPDRCDSPTVPDSPHRPRSSDADESPYQYHRHATSAGSNGSSFARGPTAAALFRPFDPFYNMRSGHGVGNSWKTDDLHHRQQHSPQDSRQSSGGEESVCSGSIKDEDMTSHFCRICDQSFSSVHALEVHVRQNHCGDGDSVGGGMGGDGRVSSAAFPCSRCPKVFELGASLEQHLATHHASRSFQVKIRWILTYRMTFLDSEITAF